MRGLKAPPRSSCAPAALAARAASIICASPSTAQGPAITTGCAPPMVTSPDLDRRLVGMEGAAGEPVRRLDEPLHAGQRAQLAARLLGKRSRVQIELRVFDASACSGSACPPASKVARSARVPPAWRPSVRRQPWYLRCPSSQVSSAVGDKKAEAPLLCYPPPGAPQTRSPRHSAHHTEPEGWAAVYPRCFRTRA